MPEKATLVRAQRAKRQGKRPATQASEFVREEMDHIREGNHSARSSKQAIAIGLSKARRAGVKLPALSKGNAKTRKSAQRDHRKGQSGRHGVSATRSRAIRTALRREARSAAPRGNLARQARSAARGRSAAQRRAAARKAVRTKGPSVRKAAARKAARTHERRSR
jgi:hypothetical protein